MGSSRARPWVTQSLPYVSTPPRQRVYNRGGGWGGGDEGFLDEVVLNGPQRCSVDRMTIVIPEGFSNGHIRYSLSSDPEEMTTAIGFSSAPGTSGEEEAFLLINSLSDAGLIDPAVFMSVYTFLGVRVERQTETGTLVTEVDEPVVGTMAGAPLPNNCAHLIDKVTNAGGRAFRGRMFWPPCFVAETGIDHQGNMAVGSQNDLTLVFEAWRDAMVTNSIPAVLFHSNPALTPTLITSLRMQQQIATQRERMR